MKKIFLFIMFILLLSGCVLKNTKSKQQQIYPIVSHGTGTADGW